MGNELIDELNEVVTNTQAEASDLTARRLDINQPKPCGCPPRIPCRCLTQPFTRYDPNYSEQIAHRDRQIDELHKELKKFRDREARLVTQVVALKMLNQKLCVLTQQHVDNARSVEKELLKLVFTEH